MNHDLERGNIPNGIEQCEITGKPVRSEDVVEFQGMRVSAKGKDILLGRLREGEEHATKLLAPTQERRFHAVFVDCLFLGVWNGLLTYGVIRATTFIVVAQIGDRGRMAFSTVLPLVSAVIIMSYPGILHAKFGKTFGKAFYECSVVNIDGTPITAWTAFVRAFWSLGFPYLFISAGPAIVQIWGVTKTLPYAATALSLFGAAYGVVNSVVMLVDKKSYRALHDRLAGTRVVRDA